MGSECCVMTNTKYGNAVLILGWLDMSWFFSLRLLRVYLWVGGKLVLSLIVFQRVDQLLLGKLLESMSMASTSLISLVQLLDKVKNMVISDRIQSEVRLCVRWSHPVSKSLCFPLCFSLCKG